MEMEFNIKKMSLINGYWLAVFLTCEGKMKFDLLGLLVTK